MADRFRLSVGWRALMPLLPAAALFVLVLLVPSASARHTTADSRGLSKAEKQVKRSAEELKKRVAKRQRLAEQRGLKDAEVLFSRLYQGLDELTKRSGLDRKQAMVKLNDLTKTLAERRRALGDPDQLRQQFSGLKNLRRGPADKLARALRRGDFQEALDQLRELAEKLEQGKLSEQERKDLAKQLAEMEEKLREIVEAHRRAKEDLERRIRQKQAQGDLEGAGKLQRQLDELKRRDKQIDRLSRMASQLGESARMLEQGDQSGAASQLDQLASEVQRLREELDQLQTLDELMDQIAAAKNAMLCKQCAGGG